MLFRSVGITAGQIRVLSELQDEELFPIGPDENEGGQAALDFKAMMEKLNDLGKKRR